jgi:putative transcriptional regulator
MKKTKSAILDAVHETVQGLYDAGVMDQITMREFGSSRFRGVATRCSM